MFSKKISLIMNELNLSSGEFAKVINCSQSTISRYKNGVRVPNTNSQILSNICRKICEYCMDSGKMKILKDIIGIDSDKIDVDDIVEIFEYWLLSDDCTESDDTKANSNVEFSVKLNKLLNILDVTNNRLSAELYVDPSYISKLRKGTRILKSNSTLFNSLCEYLAGEVIALNKESDISKVMGVTLKSGYEYTFIYDSIFYWLSSFNLQEKSIFGKFLGCMDNFSFSTSSRIPSIEDIVENSLVDMNLDTYYGIDGIRNSVLRFLSSVVKSSPGELYLYSDQNMSWMSEDKNFSMIWFILMSEVVKRGNKITIIHNIRRDLSEMITAINLWMPLYFSGMIEPYYFNTEKESRFSNTVFLSKGKSCVRASHFRGFDDRAAYHYITDIKSLSLIKDEYDFMLNKCRPLLNIYKDYSLYDILSNSDSVDGIYDINIFLTSLSIGSISEYTLSEIMDLNEIDDVKRDLLFKYWDVRKKLFFGAISEGYVNEIICLPNIETLLNNDVSIEFDDEIRYNKETFRQHLEDILDLYIQNDNYNLHIIDRCVLKNINISITNKNIFVEKKSKPQTTFVFSHLMMHKAFIEYYNSILEKCEYSKSKNISKIREYIEKLK